MSHILIRKLIEGKSEFAGRSWFYEFQSIPEQCQETTIAKASERILQQCAPITKDWNDDRNSEWVSRIYFAAKMILSSSVMAQSLEFAGDKNLRAVMSYLDYYTVLNVLRAVILTNPTVEWGEGSLLQTTHTKTINVGITILRQFDNDLASQIKNHVTHLKAFRELISYRAPSSGDSFPKADIDVIKLCKLLAEIAQMQSEIFESSALKHAIGNFSISEEAITRICEVEIDGFEFFDQEDYYRMDYLRRKHPFPTNVCHVMSEGHVEDFFGSWRAEEDEDENFNPDENWRIIFDVP